MGFGTPTLKYLSQWDWESWDYKTTCALCQAVRHAATAENAEALLRNHHCIDLNSIVDEEGFDEWGRRAL